MNTDEILRIFSTIAYVRLIRMAMNIGQRISEVYTVIDQVYAFLYCIVTTLEPHQQP